MLVATVPATALLYRITHVRYPDPAFFGKTGLHRFDDPDCVYGVCYLGTTFDCAFVETIFPMHAPPERPNPSYRYVTTAELRSRYLAEVRMTRELRLASLVGDALVSAGIDQRITAGDDYRPSQAWSKAIHERPELVDGVVYPSRHHNQLYAVALFERSRDTLHFDRVGCLGDPAVPRVWLMTQEICDRCRIGTVDTPPRGASSSA